MYSWIGWARIHPHNAVIVGSIVGKVTVQYKQQKDGNNENEGNWYKLAFQNFKITLIQGVLSLVSETRRVIVQGVYELFEKERSSEWNDDERLTRLVFIGKL